MEKIPNNGCSVFFHRHLFQGAQVNEQAVKAAGATGILRPGKNACQVIVGTKVKSIYDELDKLLK